MGAGNKLGTDQRRFRLEDIRINQVQLVPSRIGIGIAVAGQHIVICSLMGCKGVQHLFGVVDCRFLMFLGLTGHAFQGLLLNFIPFNHFYSETSSSIYGSTRDFLSLASRIFSITPFSPYSSLSTVASS